MTRAHVLHTLTENLPELREFGVKSLAIFGSMARDEAGPDSDVDILVEFSRPTGYFGLFRLQDRLARLLGRDVDLGTFNGLKPHVRARVMKEAIRVA